MSEVGKSNKRGDRSKRLLDLVMLLLQSRTPVTFKQIRQQFTSYQTANVEAGLRAFERDKADLLELGVPVRYITPEEDDSLEEGGYVVELKRFRLPEVRLTREEVSALLLAASVARAAPGGSYPKIVDLAVKKLAFDVPDAPDTPTTFPPFVSQQREPVLVHFPEETNGKFVRDRFGQLEEATRNRKRISVEYQTASTGEVRGREIDPYGLIYRQGSWLVVGHCHLREQIRTFRVDRIQKVSVAPRPKSPDFDRPDGFDVRAYALKSPWTFDTEKTEEIELEVLPSAVDVLNDGFGPQASIEKVGESHVVKLPCGNPDFAIGRIMGAKGGVLLRQGPKLQKRLVQEIETVLEHYL